MIGIIFDLLFLKAVSSLPKGNTPPSGRNDVFIPFEDKCNHNHKQTSSTSNRQQSEYYPHDIDDFFGEF